MSLDKLYSLGLYEKAFPAHFDITMMLRLAAIAGFDRLELSIDEGEERLSRLDWSERSVMEVLRECEEAGVPIRTLCLSALRKYPLGSHDAAIREKAVDIVRRTIRFASILNIRIVMLAGYDVYYEESDSLSRTYFMESLERVVPLAAEAGIVLAFETMETPFMDTVGKAMSVIERIGSPWLGIYPDIGNLQNASVLYGNDVISDLACGSGHIFAMHLKETIPGVYRNLRICGEGHTRYDDCIHFASEHDIRIFTGEFWYQGSGDYLGELKSTCSFLRSKLDKAFL